MTATAYDTSEIRRAGSHTEIGHRDLKSRLTEAGSHYLDADTMRYFNGTFDGIAREVTPNQFIIVDSVRPPFGERVRAYRVTVISFMPTGERYRTEYAEIDNIAEYTTKRAADKHRDQLADQLRAERA